MTARRPRAQRTSCDSLNLADSSTPSDTRRSDLGLTESVAELGVEGGGSREEDEWEGVEDKGMSFESERAIGMLTCHEKMISTFETSDEWISSLLVLVVHDDTTR